MIIHYHGKDKNFINSNVYIPVKFNSVFSKLIDYIGKDFTDADTSSMNTLFCKINNQGLIRKEIKDNDLAILLKELFDKTLEEIDNAYLQGKEEGKNLLISLNNGDITINEFNKS